MMTATVQDYRNWSDRMRLAGWERVWPGMLRPSISREGGRSQDRDTPPPACQPSRPVRRPRTASKALPPEAHRAFLDGLAGLLAAHVVVGITGGAGSRSTRNLNGRTEQDPAPFSGRSLAVHRGGKGIHTARKDVR